MSTLLFPLYTLSHLVVAAWGIATWRLTRRIGTLLIVLVGLGVIYDNLILSLGNTLGAGPLLQGLSIPRFVLHQLILPWLIVAGFEQAKVAGHRWANHTASGWIMLALTLAVMVAGTVTRLIPLKLEPAVMDGVTRYVAVGTKGPPLVSILSIGFVGIVGLLLWRRNRWPWEFLAAVLVFIGEGVPVEWVRRILGSGFEVLFLATMLATDRWIAINQDRTPED